MTIAGALFAQIFLFGIVGVGLYMIAEDNLVGMLEILMKSLGVFLGIAAFCSALGAIWVEVLW